MMYVMKSKYELAHGEQMAAPVPKLLMLNEVIGVEVTGIQVPMGGGVLWDGCKWLKLCKHEYLGILL